MPYTMEDIFEYVETQDVKFIRLAFCDLFGREKNCSILSDRLAQALEEGVSFDGSAIHGFADIERSDLFLFPDPATLTVLPWRPQQGKVARLFCDIRQPDRSAYHCDTRLLLKQAMRRASEMGYVCHTGVECEFYLFLTDENGEPLAVPHDRGGYFDAAPLDKGANIRREICLTLEEMGIHPEVSHHEQGPGQHEVDFTYSDMLTAADQFITFKSVVKAVAARSGLFASFMPKPIEDASGNGLHINLSLAQQGRNLFAGERQQDRDVAEHFVAGVMKRAREMAVFLNPTLNSYQRLGAFSAPQYVSWSPQNRSQLIRVPATTGEDHRFELRSADPSLNPYLAFSLLLHAGLDGIEQRLRLPEPLEINVYEAAREVTDKLDRLPQDLQAAVALARESEFLRRMLPDGLLEKYCALKEREWAAYRQAEDKARFVREHYFEKL